MSHFLAGIKSIPILAIGVFPFGLVLGLTARELEYSIWDTALQSLIVFGTAQITMLQLGAEDTSAFVVIITAAIINIRMTLYSFSISQHWQQVGRVKRTIFSFFLTDQAYAMCMNYYQKNELTAQEKFQYYLGFAISFYIFWVISTMLGNSIGSFIAPEWDMPFALPLLFLALFISLLEKFSQILSGLVAGMLSLSLHWLPNNIGFLLAIILGILSGVLWDICFKVADED